MQITLYTKPDCGLCDELKADLAALRQDAGLRQAAIEVQEIDITNIDINNAESSHAATLFERFRHLVPVLEMPGGELHYPPHDYLALRTALLAAARDATRVEKEQHDKNADTGEQTNQA